MAAPTRRGRRSGPTQTPVEIIDAARAAMATRGYEGTSVRQVAAEAGVDPALIHHFYGSKEGLLIAALELPFEPKEELAAALDGPDEGLGERIVTVFLRSWDPPEHQRILSIILRSASDDTRLASQVAEEVNSLLISQITARIRGRGRQARAAAAHSQLMGLAVSRYVLRVEPVASMPISRLARAAGPGVDALLVPTP